MTQNVDYLVIGGGFYGCSLSLFLRSLSARVLVVEAEDDLMTRASRVNQARIHGGFHYPRSALTAVKSKLLHQRFMTDFPEAVVNDFQMLYAIARRHSKVSAKRFYGMFKGIGAPIRPASSSEVALFDKRAIEDVFACTEAAFDYSVLRSLLLERLHDAGVELKLATKVVSVQDRSGQGITAALSDGTEVTASYAFNVTYAQINDVLANANLPQAALKYELAELALVEPPQELASYGVTVMDGPFFSCMPFPSQKLHSLTHVRYTPHESWTEEANRVSPYAYFKTRTLTSQFQYMMRDSQRYLPCMQDAVYQKSIYDVKAILVKNERDDGRPILYQQKPEGSRIVSILGGKIDNIYDLFDLVRKTSPQFSEASTKLLRG